MPVAVVALFSSLASAALAWVLMRHGLRLVGVLRAVRVSGFDADPARLGPSVAAHLAMRGARALGAPLVSTLGPALPAVWVASSERALRRAALEALISPAEWCLARLPVLLLACGGARLLGAGWPAALALAVLTLPVPSVWLQAVTRRRELAVLRELPFHLDMIALGLEAGGTLNAAVRASLRRAPAGPLRDALQQFAAELQAGRGRIDSLEALRRRLDFDSMAPLISTLIQAERAGGSLASVLRIQAEQRAHERFHRAEKLAMQAPVKMLGPLVLCIFPCTFVVLGFVVWSSLQAGG